MSNFWGLLADFLMRFVRVFLHDAPDLHQKNKRVLYFLHQTCTNIGFLSIFRYAKKRQHLTTAVSLLIGFDRFFCWLLFNLIIKVPVINVRQPASRP